MGKTNANHTYYAHYNDAGKYEVVNAPLKDIQIGESGVRYQYSPVLTTANVTVTPAVNGTLTAVPVGQVNSGKRVTVTAVPEDGYVLDQLTVNGTPVAVDSNGQYFFHADETAVVAAEFIPAVIKVAGYTSDDGVETLFTVDLRLTEDDVENHAYTTVEKAFAAAVYAWHGTETGTIDLYRDVEITETTKYNPSAVDNGVFYPLAGGQDSLKLNLHGNTIKSGDSLGNAYLFYPHSSTTLKLVINGKDDTSGNGTIVWDTMRAMIYTRTKASNDITINHTNVERTKANKNVSNGHLMALNANGGLVTINGGVWKLGRVNDYDVAISLATGDALSTTEGEKEVSFHLTGGVEIYATAQRIIRISNNGKVYVDDAQIHTAATEEQVAGYGYGIASITDGTNGATTASDLYTTEGFVVLGSPDGTGTANITVGETTEFSGVSVRTLSVLPYCDINAEETVNGSLTVSHGGEVLKGTEVTVTVDPDEWYELAELTINGKNVEVMNNTCTFTVTEDTVIAATFEKVESVEVAGYTAEGAAEIVYYYNRAISADDEANRTYTSVEKAFIAAKNGWNASGTGTVDIYTDVVLETVAAYDAYGVFNSPTDCDTVLLTLNLHGNRITAGKDIPGFLVRIEKTAATRDITINGKNADGEKNGLLAWDADRGVIYEGFFSGAETNIVLNNVDIIRENGGSRATNSHILAPNSDNVNVTINGGTWELRNGTMAYKIARVGRNNNTFYLTGGAVILSVASDLITADKGRTYGIHVYADDAVLYTAADDTAIDGNGKGIVGVGTPTVQWGSPDGTVTSNMTVGEATEFDGVAVRPLTVEPYVAPIVQPTLTLKAPTLEFKDMICVVAFYTAENTEDVVEMGMVTYKEKVTQWSVETADYVIPGANYDEGSGRYYSSSQGIHAKYLADTVYLACYAKLSDGSYVYTKLAPYSPITYATNQLKNSTDTSLKQLVAAMLNYGAEAQLYFGHNTENLANAGMTEEHRALPEAYREDMVQVVPTASVEKQGSFANNSGFSSRKPAISFEGAFCINYFFTPKYAPENGITLYYWNAADYNAASVLTTANASGSLKLQGTATSEYRGDITGISAKALSEAVYVAAIYTNGGTTWTSGVLGYSIGTYCSSQVSKGGTIADMAMATAVYGYHAKQYFG